MAKSIMGSKFSATLDDARRRKVLADLAAQSQGMAAAPMSSGAGRMALERASAPAMQPATRGMIGAQAPMGQARRAEAEPAPEAAPQMRTRRFQEMGMPQAQPQQRSIFGRPVEGIARAFGYDPISGMSPLAYMMSGNIGPERIKENRLTQAEERKIAQYDQFIDQANLSPQEAARARIAMRSNPEEFGKNLAAGFGTNVLPSGSMLNRGLGLPDVMNPEGEEAAKLKPQVSVGQYGATVYDPETGQARFVPAQGAPLAAGRPMTEYEAARLAMQQEQQDVAAAAKEVEQQTKQATNRRVFENTINGLVQGVNLVDQLIKAKGFNQIFGKNAAALTSDDPSTAQYLLTSQEALDALALLKQVTGQAFLGGIQQMKGFGQLSDREGTAVQQAMTRLANRSISSPEAKAAAKEFQASLQRFIQAAKTESGLSVQEIAEILGPKIPMRSSTGAPAAGGQPSYSPVRPGAVVTPPPAQSGSGGVQNYEDWARANGLK